MKLRFYMHWFKKKSRDVQYKVEVSLTPLLEITGTSLLEPFCAFMYAYI